MSLHAFSISAYNDSPYIEECIASLLDQSEKSEVLICTSTQTERLNKLAEKYGIKLYVRDGKSSLKDDWNFAVDTAVRQTGAKLITVAHQDDVYHRDYAKTVLESYHRYNDMSVFFCDAQTIDKDGKAVRDRVERVKHILRLPARMNKLSDRTFIKKSILSFGNAVNCPSCTYNVELTGMPVFENDYGFVIDWDTLLRLSEKSGRFVYVHRDLMLHRVHDGAETKKKIMDNTRLKEETEMFEKIWSKPIAAFLMKYYKNAYKAYD